MPIAREIHALDACQLSAWPSVAAASAELRHPRQPKRGGETAVVINLAPASRAAARWCGGSMTRQEGVRR